MQRKTMFYISIGCLLVSFVSLFLPVIVYTTDRKKYSYSVLTLITKADEFEKAVLMKYKGPVVWDITGSITVVLVVIFVFAIICSVIGLFTLRVQWPNNWQFILTIVGLVGVAFPSLVLIISVVGYGKYFPGKISFGPAPVITIIAMIACIFAVVRRKNRVAEEKKKELETKGLIRKAGDL